MKFLSGNEEVEIKTETERILYLALMSVLYAEGKIGYLRSEVAVIKMPRFTFLRLQQQEEKQTDQLQVYTNGNNGRDVVRIVKGK